MPHSFRQQLVKSRLFTKDRFLDCFNSKNKEVENNSVEYTEQIITTMIDQYLKNEWIFTYIGANHNVKETSSRISIRSCQELTSNSKGTIVMHQINNKERENAYYKHFKGIGHFLNDEFFD
jgi:hypothetical protein